MTRLVTALFVCALPAFPAWGTAKGFDFRSTLAFVSDPANTQDVLGEAYPQTTTIGGDSVVWGWKQATGISSCGGSDNSAPLKADRSAAVDVRLAGINYGNQMHCTIFRVDLPATGSYTLRIANGDQGSGQTNTLTIYDGTTSLWVVSSAVSLSSNQYIDATGVTRTSDTLWVSNNVSKTLTFSTTTLYVVLNDGSANAFTTLAYVQVTQNAGGPPANQFPRIALGHKE
jgi:hypothetical protein